MSQEAQTRSQSRVGASAGPVDIVPITGDDTKIFARGPLPKMGVTTGADAVIRCLLAEGVETIFGYPGGAIMPVYDSLYYARGSINHILVRHEQGAAHAAEGYAYSTGRVGVCLATSGPGATNLVTGIADAMMDSVPLVCITGQVHSPLLGSDAFQETDVIGITIPITKWNYQVTSPAEIPAIISKAFHLAKSGRPGPVVVDITKDAQVASFNWEDVKLPEFEYHYAKHVLDPSSIKRAAELINQSRRPLMLVGHGVRISNAEKEVHALATKAQIPVACTLLGLSACPTDHELYVGMLGMHGNYAPNMLTNEADLIIGVGMRFDDRVTGNLKRYATKAKVIHIEVDPAEVGKNVPVAVALVADAKQALAELVRHVEPNTRPDWLANFKELEEIEHAKVIKNAVKPAGGKISMSEATAMLSDAAAGQAIVVADVGQHQMMAARYFKFKQHNSFITSGGLGTMGFALPAAMGAKIGRPDRTVIAVIGDGCFQMTIQELGTIAQEKLPVKIVVMNNNFLGMVRQWQELFFESRYSFVHLDNPDFVKVSEGFGVPASRVSDREDLPGAITKMLESPGPYCLEIVVEKEQNVFPMIPAGAAVSDIRLE